jgi:hypothetical protein
MSHAVSSTVAGLTWTQQAQCVANFGQTTMFTAPCAAGGTGTVTVSGLGTHTKGLICCTWVITGHHPTTPVGYHGSFTGSANPFRFSIPNTGIGSLLLGFFGNGTSSTPLTYNAVTAQEPVGGPIGYTGPGPCYVSCGHYLSTNGLGYTIATPSNDFGCSDAISLYAMFSTVEVLKS